MRNVKTREGFEYWDKICSLKHYGFLHSPDGKRVVKTEGIGNWIDKFEAQEIVDQAQDEINQYRAERDALRNEVGQVKGEYDRAVNKIDALQLRLTAADEREDRLAALTNDDLIKIARTAALNSVDRYSYMPCIPEEAYAWEPHYWVIEAMRAALMPAAPERIKGMVEATNGEYAIMIDPEHGHFGWTFKRHPDGQWVSGRKATEPEMYAARQCARARGIWPVREG